MTVHSPLRARLAPLLPGLMLAVLTILFGQGLGVAFGAAEGDLKATLRARAAAVQDTVYKGDAMAAKPVVDKAWTYFKRAHLHAGGMGTTAVALALLLAALGVGKAAGASLSLGLGLGGLGYSLFWLLAGLSAPGLGSTGAAKEGLAWLALPSSALFVLATVGCLVCVGRAMLRPPAG